MLFDVIGNFYGSIRPKGSMRLTYLTETSKTESGIQQLLRNAEIQERWLEGAVLSGEGSHVVPGQARIFIRY
jgi:hypothetical protein